MTTNFSRRDVILALTASGLATQAPRGAFAMINAGSLLGRLRAVYHATWAQEEAMTRILPGINIDGIDGVDVDEHLFFLAGIKENASNIISIANEIEDILRQQKP